MTLNAKFVLSRSQLIEQYNKITDIGTISYSVKTNPVVASILEQETDCMFCIHTMNELEYVKDTKRVWFLAESWTLKQIEKLYTLGIKNFAVHNKNDLNKLIEFNSIHNSNKSYLLLCFWMIIILQANIMIIRTQLLCN